MSILIDYKYANLLGTRLPKYKLQKSSPFKAMARCIACGDSKTHLNKRRFYIFERKGAVSVNCFNCGYSAKIGWFLKEYFPDLNQEYLMDIFKENRSIYEADPITNPKKPMPEREGGLLAGLSRISQLPVTHPAKVYIDSRKIPPEFHSKMYFTTNFQTWINGLVPEKFEKPAKYDPRIIIPFYDQKGDVFAVQGRAISEKQNLRYITIKFDEDHPKVFGLERINTNFRVWVLEGPIDSLFIPNAVAMGGSDISNQQLCELLDIDKSRIIKVYDNEPRNLEIIKRMKKDLDEGYKIVIWPKTIHEKDINKMVTDEGLDPNTIVTKMIANTYSGLQGQLKLTMWGKVVSS